MSRKLGLFGALVLYLSAFALGVAFTVLWFSEHDISTSRPTITAPPPGVQPPQPPPQPQKTSWQGGPGLTWQKNLIIFGSVAHAAESNTTITGRIAVYRWNPATKKYDGPINGPFGQAFVAHANDSVATGVPPRRYCWTYSYKQPDLFAYLIFDNDLAFEFVILDYTDSGQPATLALTSKFLATHDTTEFRGPLAVFPNEQQVEGQAYRLIFSCSLNYPR